MRLAVLADISRLEVVALPIVNLVLSERVPGEV